MPSNVEIISIETKLRFENNEDRESLIEAMKMYSPLVKYGIKCLRPQFSAKKEVYRILNEKFPNLPSRTVALAVEQDVAPVINSFCGLEAKNFPLTMRFDKGNAKFFVEEKTVKVKMGVYRPKKGKIEWITASLMPKRNLKYKYYKILFSTQKGYELPFKIIMRNGQLYAKISVKKEKLVASSTKLPINVGIDLNAFWVSKNKGNPLAVAFLNEEEKFVMQPRFISEWAEIPELIRKHQCEGKGKVKKVVTNQLGLIVKKLIDLTKDYQPTFKLEDLTGLNKLKGAYSKFFYKKLVEILETKSLNVQLVNPRYTSQICSKCGILGKAEGRHFSCSCGYTQHRDINAAINIAKR